MIPHNSIMKKNLVAGKALQKYPTRKQQNTQMEKFTTSNTSFSVSHYQFNHASYHCKKFLVITTQRVVSTVSVSPFAKCSCSITLRPQLSIIPVGLHSEMILLKYVYPS